MALNMKVKHVDSLANGVLRFRRRFPKDVIPLIDQPTMQVHIRNTTGIAFQRQYQAIMQEFDRICAEARAAAAGNDTRSPMTRWHEALLKAEGLVAETVGLDDDPTFARNEIARGLAQRGGSDPLQIKALTQPTTGHPERRL